MIMLSLETCDYAILRRQQLTEVPIRQENISS